MAWALVIATVLLAQGDPEIEENCDLLQEVSFIQINKSSSVPKPSQLAARESHQHYWPHTRGQIGSESRTNFGLPGTSLKDMNLSSMHAWSWKHPLGRDSIMWGTLIDMDKNIYVAGTSGIFKLDSDGQQLWQYPISGMTFMPVLMGDALYGMEMQTAMMYAVDLVTGAEKWKKKVGSMTGSDGDVVEARNGVIVAGVDNILTLEDMQKPENQAGSGSKRLIGVRASDAQELWSYQPNCAMWNVMPLFPDEDTLVFMDQCGAVYRLGLHDGSEIWKHEGSMDSFTDGGATLGLDGSIYTCSNLNETKPSGEPFGVVRKYSLGDGNQVWATKMANSCMNFPAVSADGRSMIVLDGTNVIYAPTKKLKDKGLNQQQIDSFYELQTKLLANKSQLNFYGYPNLNASILAYDTHTGQLSWQHDVEPWYGMGFAGDEERAYNWVSGKANMPHCGPAHWGAASVDNQGRIYAHRSNGEFYVYDPQNDEEMTYFTGDGQLPMGSSHAPGMLVVPTCSAVDVFKF